MRVDVHVNEVAEQGYTIVQDAIEPDFVDALNDDLLRLEEFFAVEPAPNSFEGHHTIRIYNLLAYGALYERIPVHDHVLPVVEGVLDPGCLISSLSSISMLEGETAQPIHADDQLIPLPKPHPPTVCTFAVIVGENEVAKSVVMVKDLSKEEQFEVPRSELIKALRVEIEQAEALGELKRRGGKADRPS